MTTYPKINAPFKRYTSGPEKGKLIIGEWCDPAFKYLQNNQWEFSEKVDGTNIRIYLTRHQDSVTVEFRGRTDRSDIPAPLLDELRRLFPDSHSWDRGGDRGWHVGQWMVDNGLTEVVLYGEGYGPKVQNGGKYCSDPSFVLFDAKVGPLWLSRGNVNDVAEKLGIDSVPVVGRGTLNDAFDLVRNRLKSQWGDFEAEGVIARPAAQLFNAKGERITTKIKAVDFR